MTDHRTRLAARDPDFAESVEDLLRRQRAGLIRQVDVGRCTEPVEDPREPCPACNGTGRRYRSGLELAAYCGHEAARLALGHEALRYARTDEDYRAWWAGMASGWPRVAAAHGLHYTVSHYEEAKAHLIRWALTEPGYTSTPRASSSASSLRSFDQSGSSCAAQGPSGT